MVTRTDGRLAASIAILPFVLVALASPAACGRSVRHPNVLLITLDTTRADHLGAYGYAEAQTPNIDRLAREGLLFERAATTAPITLPAHVSLLTGLYPFAHGVRNNGNFRLADSVPTVATALRDAGFSTAAFVSAFVLARRYGLDRGFADYDDQFELERRGDATAAAAASWFERHVAEPTPFFVWVHLYDPHDPYDPPSPFRESFARSPYDGELAFDDRVIGSLLDRLAAVNLLSSTLVAIVGDHGESLGEHREATHGMFVYESAVRVPMIIWWPGTVPARRVASLVRTIDLAPTLLALVERPGLNHIDGRSLVPLFDGRSQAAPDGAYSETYFPRQFMNWSPLRSLRDDRWKFIEAPVPELYDLSADPGETANLALREPARLAAMQRALNDLTGGMEGVQTSMPIDRETREKLAALGYVGEANRGSDRTGEAGRRVDDRPGAHASRADAHAGVPGVPGINDTRPDPKAMIDVFNQLRAANSAIQARRYAEAETAGLEALQRDANNAFALMIVGRAEMEQGRYQNAIARYRRYADLVPASADAHHWMAVCYSRMNDIAAALVEEDAALGLDSRHAEAHALRGGLLARLGRTDEAVSALRKAVEAAPGNVAFQVGLARLLVSARHLEEARVVLAGALARQPANPDAHAAAGTLLAARGEFDDARLEFERSLGVRPDADDVRLDYAEALDRSGRREEARAQYVRLAESNDTPPDIRRVARDRLRQRPSR
jgi:choline-sulfatase